MNINEFAKTLPKLEPEAVVGATPKKQVALKKGQGGRKPSMMSLIGTDIEKGVPAEIAVERGKVYGREVGLTEAQMRDAIVSAEKWEAKEEAKAKAKHATELLCLDEVTEKPVEWMWDDILPEGELSQWCGDGESAKTTMTAELIARRTRGLRMFGDRVDRPAINVLIIGAEDSLETMTKPRLRIAGADMKRIFVLPEYMTFPGKPKYDRDGKQISPDLMKVFIEFIERYDIGLIVYDNIVGKLDPGLNGNKEEDVRAALNPLKAYCQSSGRTALFIKHFNKAIQTTQATSRSGGSVAWVNLCRIYVVFVKQANADGENHFSMQVAKANIIKDKVGFGFTLESRPSGLFDRHGRETSLPRVKWDEEVLHTTADAMLRKQAGRDKPLEPTKMEMAEAMLERYLAKEPMVLEELQRCVMAEGVAEITFKRAKKEVCKWDGGKGIPSVVWLKSNKRPNETELEVCRNLWANEKEAEEANVSDTLQ